MEAQLTDLIKAAEGLLSSELTSIWFYIQLMLIGVAALAAMGMAAFVRARTDLTAFSMGWPAPLRLFVRGLRTNAGPLLFALITAVMRAVMVASTWPSRSYFLAVAASLATAWLVIAMIAGLIRNKLAVRLVAVSAWTVAALSILGVLDDTLAALDSVAIQLGGLRLSPLLVIKLVVLLAVTLWVANALGKFLETRINSSADLTPSLRVLITKLVRLALITIAVVVGLSSVGIDLSALAFFSGAVGVGLGFGLQKIVSNFVSGIILLADKSIKPGDVVTVGENQGRVGTMNTRYITIVPGDGREVLVPNEDLVTQKVTNWSYRDKLVRYDIPFGVSYASDPHHVRNVAVTAAAAVEGVLPAPPPGCGLAAFGASSIDFILSFWVDDPTASGRNTRSDVMFALWDAFKREGIEIPYPVQEVRLGAPVQVALSPPERPAAPVPQPPT